MALLIMVAGPYRSGGADAARRAANLRLLNEAALAVFRRGHTPLIGVNAALPIIEVAGETVPETGGEAAYDAIMMPVSLALADRCDACLRVGGPSRGADEEVERFRARGLPVFFRVEDIPS